MSDVMDQVLDEIGVVERKVDKLAAIMLADNQEIVLALRQLSAEVNELQKAVHLARRPDEESLLKSKALKDAYENYVFVKELAIGKPDDTHR